jgi:hypothetical protein
LRAAEYKQHVEVNKIMEKIGRARAALEAAD